MGKLEIISLNTQMSIISNKQIIHFFYTYFIKHMEYVSDKFKTHKNSKMILIYVGNIIFNVFWVVFGSSYNIFISLFLSEKSVLLFTEFIILSENSDDIKNLNFKPNLLDAVIFSYKKTINTIPIDSLIKNSKTMNIVKACFFFKELMKLIYTNTDKFNTDSKNKIIEQTNSNIYTFENRKGIIFYSNIINKLQF